MVAARRNRWVFPRDLRARAHCSHPKGGDGPTPRGLIIVWFLTKNHAIMSRPFSAESVYRALAHPTRRRVLEILRVGERPASHLVGAFKLSKPVLSEHLQVLRLTGLITVRRRGTSLIYRLNAGPLRQVSDWLGMIQQPARIGPASRD